MKGVGVAKANTNKVKSQRRREPRAKFWSESQASTKNEKAKEPNRNPKLSLSSRRSSKK
jgi:hypothetical protein